MYTKDMYVYFISFNYVNVHSLVKFQGKAIFLSPDLLAFHIVFPT